ncbi:hypothetical protein PVK06_046297 [Gossypium arboreum]|uniref:Uncharacterized protein n=1 Tax=Gossypium arboreum TaxID=29729 RepID=A0ABR0MC28_GOSAR|nr:hypothetical protein PVK06_046297 [Gossypium arboreum]
MDNKKPGNDGTADEVTRESLIAISYSLPDKVVAASKLSSDNSNREKLFERKGSDGDEKYRSELISISYSQSPEGPYMKFSINACFANFFHAQWILCSIANQIL